MANIIQNFTDNLLDLTSNGTYYETFDERNGDYIRVK